SILLGPPPPLGTPPELVISWSTDDKLVALFDGKQIRLVTVATARTIGSQPPAQGTVPTAGGATGSLAPVFVDTRKLVVLDNCCIGDQRLVAIDLASGSRRLFATLAAPPESLARIEPGVLLVVTAARQLLVLTKGHI